MIVVLRWTDSDPGRPILSINWSTVAHFGRNWGNWRKIVTESQKLNPQRSNSAYCSTDTHDQTFSDLHSSVIYPIPVPTLLRAKPAVAGLHTSRPAAVNRKINLTLASGVPAVKLVTKLCWSKVGSITKCRQKLSDHNI